MRYRLRTLLIAIALAGLVFLALSAPSKMWSCGLFTALVFALLTSVIVAINRGGKMRAMAIGFFVFSAGYLIVEGNSWPGSASGLHLPTDDLIQWTFKHLHSEPSLTNDPFNPKSEVQRYFAYKGICVASLAFVSGALGAVIAQALYNSRTPDFATNG